MLMLRVVRDVALELKYTRLKHAAKQSAAMLYRMVPHVAYLLYEPDTEPRCEISSRTS